ncbi:MAG TPA: amidohydrolase family protein [Acidimicrobiales bacterium]|nr:amidohydrolase family protein [Acidimicrobiales bacterium]
MLPASTKLMSADDHIIEPPHLWVERVAARYRDECPRIVEVDGRQAWLYEDELTYIAMGSCRALPGFDEAGYPPAPGTARFDEIRPGCYDPAERIRDMDVDGVWGQLCFPNYARFAGHRFFLNVKDPELGIACLRTYNDYLLDDWCATAPDRLFGAVILPLHDVDAAVVELRRVIAKGARAVAFSENPTVLGLPSIHTGHWDPLLAVANEARVPICMHIGSSSKLVTTSEDAPPTVLVSLNGLNSMMAGVDWLMSGVLERFPDIKVILSEGGAGWIPYILERADKAFHDRRLQRNDAIGQTARATTPPSQLFAQHMYVCLVDEHFALRSLGDIPVDNLLWEGDYPHGDGLWPHNHSYLEKALANVPDVDAVRIAESNLRNLLHV